jgi:hypothetical protein
MFLSQEPAKRVVRDFETEIVMLVIGPGRADAVGIYVSVLVDV